MRRIAIILNAMTQLLGALLCVTLNSNESTSGAALRRSPKFWRKAINAIFFWQDDHCLQAARNEIDDCRELLLAYGFAIEPPEQTVEQAAQAVKANTETRIPTAAEIEEATLDDPMSPDFNVIAWFARLPYEAKRRIVEWGVSIRMSKPNRIKAYNVAQAWWQADGKPREGHGMVAE
jgi:hypothetical protein